MSAPKPLIGIHQFTKHEYGHTTTHVRIMHGRLVDVRALIAGTWDNRAGYGTSEAAERLRERYTGYLREGISTIFELPYHAPYLHVGFLHAAEATIREFPGHNGFCEPTYELGMWLDTIQRNLPLLRKCEGRRTRSGRWVPAVKTPDQLCARFPGHLLLSQTGVDPYGMVRDYFVPGLDLTLTPERACEAYAV